MQELTNEEKVLGKIRVVEIIVLTRMVVNGKAAVEFDFQAIAFTIVKTKPNGTGKTEAVNKVFQAQFLPFNCLNNLPEINPPIHPQRAKILRWSEIMTCSPPKMF